MSLQQACVTARSGSGFGRLCRGLVGNRKDRGMLARIPPVDRRLALPFALPYLIFR
jgi:hypothetical protein